MTYNTDETQHFNRTFQKCSTKKEIISQEFNALSPGEPDLNKSDLLTTNDRIKNMYYDSVCDKI